MDSVEFNKSVYDQVADEYVKMWDERVIHQEVTLLPYINRLKNQFNQPRVLDMGCGAGLDCLVMSNHSLEVVGVDISINMVKHAKKNAPLATIMHDDFIEGDIGGNYDGILMDATFHLFPKKYTPIILKRVNSLMHDDSIGMISTTNSDKSIEGYFVKSDYKKKIKRYRKHWMEEELVCTLESNGFKVIHIYGDEQSYVDKKWMNILFTKNIK